MLSNFKGTQYRLANNWFNTINVNDYKDKPINYLEIGAFYGANIISVGLSYGLHNESKLFCIDPWEDYNEYNEYKNEQPHIYETFNENIKNSGFQDKIIINRGYSNKEVCKFDDDFFDIIYIDGNHEPEYVLEDAVISFRKLKVNGIMIFDDYGWGGPDLTQKGIDAFLSGYSKRIQYLNNINTQVLIKKIK
jgi:predicted O-methyltransferase YrrM